MWCWGSSQVFMYVDRYSTCWATFLDPKAGTSQSVCFNTLYYKELLTFFSVQFHDNTFVYLLHYICNVFTDVSSVTHFYLFKFVSFSFCQTLFHHDCLLVCMNFI
ncbi:hypothetical protein ACRRTK_016978 [Alexandromys fortis]